MFNKKLRHNFIQGEAITIDEQLFPYRGRTKFTQYIPSKAAKYGIKVWWACDSTNGYPCQGIIYTGKEDGQVRETNQGQRVLLELSEPYKSSGRTIVADNFFTTLEAERILQSSSCFCGNFTQKQNLYSC
uniref:PiggyBac transposable element-derived protein domain-containing protein n=1 Tax=Cacopsylla melanoneura TaxID=428564 RepID=A0A8D9E8K7_9HEMI